MSVINLADASAKKFDWLDFHHRLQGCIHVSLFAAFCAPEDIAAGKAYMRRKGFKFWPGEEALEAEYTDQHDEEV